MDLRVGLWLAFVPGVLSLAATEAEAQLRPYEPTPWDFVAGSHRAEITVGGRYLVDQTATLAAVRGDLVEAGLLEASVRVGTVSIRALGAPWRRLSIEQRLGEPAPGTRVSGDRSISGVGDFSIETIVPLLDGPGGLGILRFGTRLPTTDNRIGLERDRIDFHALLSGRRSIDAVTFSAELGVGIHGTREAEYEQSDVLIYMAGLEWQGRARWGAEVVGHADGLRGRSIRGNEELAEVRLFVRSQGRIAVRIEALAGLTDASPSHGIGVHLSAAVP